MSDYIKREDAISRQAAIDSIRTKYCPSDFMDDGVIDVFAEIIKDLPSAQQWIPCSERLPEKSGRYLVTNTRLGSFEVDWNIFYNGKGEAPDGWLHEDGTIAWMPLPKPYKGADT